MSSVTNNPFTRLGRAFASPVRTAQREGEQACESISLEQKEILEALPEATALLEVSGEIVFASDKTIESYGQNFSKFIGSSLVDHINVGDRVSFLKALSDCVSSQIITETSVRTSAERKLKFRFSPFTLKVTGSFRQKLALATIQDASETQCLLDEAREKAEVAIRSAEEANSMLATASHELRTPLNAIIGFADILKSQSDTPLPSDKNREYAEYIHQASTSLLVLLNGVLNVSKMQAGKLPINPEPMDLCDLVRSSVKFFKESAAARSVSLSYNFSSEIPQIVADENAIRQVLANLISNAIKFSAYDGHVEITVGRIGRSVTIKVTDNGIGIEHEHVRSLGEKYFQAKTDHTVAESGTGLGLSIVKGILEQHNGRMEINSQKGAGTSVLVTLPICTQPSAVVPSNESTDLVNLTDPNEEIVPSQITLNQRLA